MSSYSSSENKYYAIISMSCLFLSCTKKAFNLSAQSKVEIETKWDLVKLEDVADIISGGTPDTQNPNFWDGEICWATLVDTKSKYLYDTNKKISQLGLEKSSAKLLPINTVIFSSRASIGEVTIAKVATSTNQGFKNFICEDSKIHYEYLYEVLKFYAKNIEYLAGGMTYKEISKTSIANFKIPLPPLDIQQKIVEECEAVDNQVEQSQSLIAQLENNISSIIQNIEGDHIKIGSLFSYSNIRIQADLLNADTYVGVDNLLPNTKGKKPSEFVPNSGTVTQYDAGDVLLSNIRPYLKKIWLANAIGGASNDVLVLKKQSKNIIEKYFFYNLKQDQFFEYSMLGKKGVKMPRGDKNQILDYQIPVPPLAEQERIVQQIEILETQIAQAQKIIDDAPQQKQAILQKYL